MMSTSLKARFVITAVLLSSLMFYASPLVAAPGDVTVVAGDGFPGFAGDGGPATEAQFQRARGLAVDSEGNLFIADTGNRRVRKVDTEGNISTLAILEYEPQGVALDEQGNIYVSTYEANTVFKIDADLNISSFINSVEETIYNADSIDVDSEGNVYLAEESGAQIWRIDPSGVASLIVRRSIPGRADDETVIPGLLTASDINVDIFGNLFIADSEGSQIYKRDSTGVVTVVAGTGISGSTGDGGLATEARLYQPRSIAVDSSGRLFIANQYQLRLVDSSGVICSVFMPYDYLGGISDDLEVDAQGNVYASTFRQIEKVESASCGVATWELIRDDADLSLLKEILIQGGWEDELSQCSSSWTVLAPINSAIEQLLAQLGLEFPQLVASSALVLAILNDHISMSYYLLRDLEQSASPFPLQALSGLLHRYSQRPPGPVESRKIGENLYVNEAFIRSGFDTCSGLLLKIDALLSWPPFALRSGVQWTGPATPTSSRNLLFTMRFEQPVTGLTSADFENLGTQQNCVFSPTKGNVLSDYSSTYYLTAVCSGPGTVAPRLKAVSVMSQSGERYLRDIGGPVIDIVGGTVLSVIKTGDGVGKVESTISAIECGLLCSGVFPAGTRVTLRATPQPGSLFVGWSGACRGTGECTIRLSSPQTVQAEFRLAGAVVITKTGSGSGSVTARSAGINCGTSAVSPCVSWHLRDVPITLQAAPSRGSRFVGWMGACTGTGTCTVYASNWSNGFFEEATHVFPIFERN